MIAVGVAIRSASLPLAASALLFTATFAGVSQAQSVSVPARPGTSGNDRLVFEVPRALAGRDLVVIARVADIQPHATNGLFRGKLLGTRIIHHAERGERLALDWRSTSQGAAMAVDADVALTAAARTPAAPTEPESPPVRSSLRSVRRFAERAELDVEHVFTDRTVTVHWSVLLRPAVPMMARFADWRVPIDASQAPATLVDEATTALGPNRPVPDQIIHRFRLEKKDPTAAVSEVVQPIVFYLDPKMPKRWVRWMKLGVEVWQPVFEAIGFRNAIVAREAPTREEDSTWVLEDGTHNTILYVGDNAENGGGGGSAFDDATGEVFTGVVGLHGGVEALLQRVGFALLGGNPDIPLPFPDSILGELLAMATAHEVGHALSLPHNFKGASAFPTDSARNRAFIRRMGYSGSLMDYAYFNFLPQPEDSVPFSDRHGRIGLFDKFAIAWAYQPIPGANTPVAELPTLEQWRKAQDTATYLRGSVPQAAGIDPGDQMDDIGADLVRSADWATKNFARAGARLVAMREQLSTSGSGAGAHDTTPNIDAAGEPRWAPRLSLDMVAEYQNEILHRWRLAMSHAAGIVGGAVPTAPYAAVADSQQFTPFDSARQVTALRFVLDHVFRGKDELVQKLFATASTPLPDAASLVMAQNFGNGWEIAVFHDKQAMIIGQLLGEDVLNRLLEQSPKTGVLPVFCTEIDHLRQELAPAIASARGSKDMTPLTEIQRQIVGVVADKEGFCRAHGWTPTP